MATKAKASKRVPAPPPKAQSVTSGTTSLTMEERLRRIETIGQRIDEYILFICKIATMAGTSGEAKERGVAAFYEQMLIVERQLAKVHDELRLE